MKVIRSLVLALLIAAPASAQQVIGSGTLTAANGTVGVNPAGAVALTINVSGTYVGTVTFQCDPNGGGTFGSILATVIADGTTASTTTSTGSFAVPNVGCMVVQAKMTSYTSGTAVVTITRGFLNAKVPSISPTAPVFTGAVTGGSFLAGDGSASAPAYAGVNHTTTGCWFTSGPETFRCGVGGVERLRLSAGSGLFGDIVSAGTAFISGGSGLAVANVGANSCGTSAASIAGNNNAFRLTVGATAGTQCRVTFTFAATTEWDCAASDSTTTIATRTTPVDTTHTDFFGAFVAGDTVTGICFPR